MYLSELLGEDFKAWGNSKILLSAPTGLGKTSFVVNCMLPFYKERGLKLLILCNRKLLRLQYWYTLIQKFEHFDDVESAVAVKTCQEVAEILSRQRYGENFFEEYDGVICDECHYFYSDSDFNGIGTYVFLQEFIWQTMGKQVLYMSATIDCISRQLIEIINACAERYPEHLRRGINFQNACHIRQYNYSCLANYDYVTCRSFLDIHTLTEFIANSKGKSIVFWDNKKKAEELKESLIKTSKITKKDVVLLDAQKVDLSENEETISTLALANRLVPRVLITTSVLDNGVSICDTDVKNLCVITDSKVSFLQMLGRVRATKDTKINLLFLVHESDYYKNRELQLKEQLKYFPSKDKKNNCFGASFEIWSGMWGNDDVAAFYRRVYLPCKRSVKILDVPPVSVEVAHGDVKLVINQFAYQKISDSYLWAGKFHQMVQGDICGPIYEQLKWLGKQPDELEKVMTHFEEGKRQELVSVLKRIVNYSLEDFKAVKRDIAIKFGPNILSDFDLKKESFCNETFSQIIKPYGFQLVTEKGDGRQNCYTVCVSKGGERADDDCQGTSAGTENRA